MSQPHPYDGLEDVAQENFIMGNDYILKQLDDLINIVHARGGDSINITAGLLRILAKEGYYERIIRKGGGNYSTKTI